MDDQPRGAPSGRSAAGTCRGSGGSGRSGDAGRRNQASARNTAPGRLATSTMTPKTTAVATPRSAPSPAAPNSHAVAPSRGPQPAMLGSTMASITSNARGSIRDTGAVAPAVRAAIANVTAKPPTTTVEASAMP